MGSVLVVEDNEDLRLLYAEAFKHAAVRSTSAINGSDALRHLAESLELPQLIVLDMMMPVMDGWTFLAEKKKDARLAGIPVIVCSAAPSRDLPPDVEFMRKPIDIRRLLSKVQQFC